MRESTKRNQPMDILVSNHQPETVNLTGYIIGFAGSLVLTMAAYLSVRYGLLDKPMMIGLLTLLALTQFAVQLIYFLHVGKEFSPRLKLVVMFMMIGVVFILVAGSLWIMDNIDNRMMNPQLMVRYMHNQDNL